MEFGLAAGSGSEDCVPNFGRSFSICSEIAQRELTLPDAMHEFDARDGDRRMSKSLEREHGP